MVNEYLLLALLGRPVAAWDRTVQDGPGQGARWTWDDAEAWAGLSILKQAELVRDFGAALDVAAGTTPRARPCRKLGRVERQANRARRLAARSIIPGRRYLKRVREEIVLRDHRLCDGAKITLGWLIVRAGAQGWVELTSGWIGGDLGRTSRTIRNHIRALKRAGHISATPHDPVTGKRLITIRPHCYFRSNDHFLPGPGVEQDDIVVDCSSETDPRKWDSDTYELCSYSYLENTDEQDQIECDLETAEPAAALDRGAAQPARPPVQQAVSRCPSWEPVTPLERLIWARRKELGLHDAQARSRPRLE